MGAYYIAIVRHTDATCTAKKVWKFKDADVSLMDYFKQTSSYQRKVVTTGGAKHYEETNKIDNDPIFGDDGDLAFNWWYSNNGARIVVDNGKLSAAGTNDDDTHGIGNEFGAGTNSGGYAQPVNSASWWHDVAGQRTRTPDCHGTSCKVQGTDHGSAWGSTNYAVYGSYAIYVSTEDSTEVPDISCGAMGVVQGG